MQGGDSVAQQAISRSSQRPVTAPRTVQTPVSGNTRKVRRGGILNSRPKNRRAADGGESAEKRTKRREPGLRIYDGNLDMLFFSIVIVLLVYGIVMMFSASYIAGLNSREHDGYMYVRTQGVAAVLGVIAMVFISFWDYHVLMNSKLVVFGFLGTLALLTYTSFFGDSVAGARRWITLGGEAGGGLSVQPSEIMKAVLIVFLAYIVVVNEKNLQSFSKGVVPLLLILGSVCLNMVLQRHISGLLLMGTIGMMVLFVGGMPMKRFLQLLAIGAAGAVLAALAYSFAKGGGLSYILDRFAGMSQAENGEMTDDSWQTMQSLIAIGSGGWFGLGFGESLQKYAWLPESQNDFVLPIIVEELGFLGGIVVVFLFGMFIYRGFYIAKKAPDKFGMMIAAGITFQIGLQALLNIGVACSAFPNTGISLPFFSYGGTALLIQLAEMGVVLSVSRQCEI